MGNAIHERIENSLKDNPEYMVERKITRCDKDRRTVAKFDAFHIPTGSLYDHKFTTTYIHGKEAKQEWVNQLNLNAFFIEEEGYPVKNAVINALYKDWRPTAYKNAKAGAYPPCPAGLFYVPLWDQKTREKFYNDRLQKHIAAETIPDDGLPECTPEECWEDPGKVAVKRPGLKRAMKLCDSVGEAEKYIEDFAVKNATIEVRPSVRRRCADYCPGAPYCNQYKKWKKENEKNV